MIINFDQNTHSNFKEKVFANPFSKNLGLLNKLYF